MKHLFSSVAGVAIAASLAATAPAEAQSRSPVSSGMQPQSSFTPPPGTTMHRQNPDGSSTPVSREEFLRGTQQQEPNYQQHRQNDYHYQGYESQRSEAYERGRDAGEYEAQSRRNAERSHAQGRVDYQLGCGAPSNGGSWYNQGQGAVDRWAGSDVREGLRIFGMSATNRTSYDQAQCRINQLPPGEQRDRAQGEYDVLQRERFNRQWQGEASRRIFGRSP